MAPPKNVVLPLLTHLSVKTVAERQRHAAYHDKALVACFKFTYWWRSF